MAALEDVWTATSAGLPPGTSRSDVRNRMKLAHSCKIQYIIQGDQCPICFEPILYERSAVLLPCCGHGVHASCLNKHVHYTELAACSSFYRCALCRQSIPLKVVERWIVGKHRYPSPQNGLDFLENSQDQHLLRQHICLETVPYVGKGHALGMRFDCKGCLAYRHGRYTPPSSRRLGLSASQRRNTLEPNYHLIAFNISHLPLHFFGRRTLTLLLSTGTYLMAAVLWLVISEVLTLHLFLVCFLIVAHCC
eukprot:scaffold4368_cov180-Ochromonas_danica.AAC.14